MEKWESVLTNVASDVDIRRKSGLSDEWWSSVTKHLVRAARERFNLQQTLAESSRESFNDPLALDKNKEQGLIASLIVNDFINCLGTESFVSDNDNLASNPKIDPNKYPGEDIFVEWRNRLRSIISEEDLGPSGERLRKMRSDLVQLMDIHLQRIM